MKCHIRPIRFEIRIRIVTPDSIHIRFERKRTIRRSLAKLSTAGYSVYKRSSWGNMDRPTYRNNETLHRLAIHSG